jgi:hypothetical protein
MAFKIKNITNTLNGKHPSFNTTIDVKYNIKFRWYTQKIRPDQETILAVNDLPLELHKLRIKGLINVIQISDNEYEQTKLKSERFLYGDTRKKVETKMVDSPIQKSSESVDFMEAVKEYVKHENELAQVEDSLPELEADSTKSKKKKTE